MSQLSPELQIETILVVDDTRDDLHLLSNMLISQGYHVRSLAHGSMVLRSVQMSPPDLIILDVLMPGMDGYAICEALRADEATRDVPVIFISALHDVSNKVRGFAHGGVDYIAKPFHAEEVLARVATHLSIRRMHRQLQAQNQQLQREITERQRAEAALRENQRFLTHVTETIPALVYVYDLHQKRIVYVNREAVTDLTALAEAMDGQSDETLQELVHPDDLPRVLAYLQQVSINQQDTVLECTYRVRYGTNEWRWLHNCALVFARMPAGSPRQIVNTAMDITEQRQTVELLHQQQQALGLLRERERLTRELHDTLGQVLGAINTQSQTIHDLLTHGQLLQVQPLVLSVLEMTRTAQAHVRDFIAGTRSSLELHDLPQEEGSRLVTALKEHCRWLEQLYGFRTELHVTGEVLTTTLSPLVEVQLVRIVQEALTNTRKYADVATAHVSISVKDEEIHVCIEDQGHGFDLEHANGSQNGKSYPSYGLRSMHERAEEIGGTLEIASIVGQGTRVHVRVPFFPIVTYWGLDARILLVDDYEPFLRGLQAVLEARQLTIVGYALDGRAAVEQAHRLHPDVILMDIEMPGMNGLEATRQIRAALPDIQIVMLTAADDDERLFAALQSGAAGYLTKDLTADEMYQMLVDLSRGEVPLSPGLARRILHEFASQSETDAPSAAEDVNLNARQREIIALVVQGHTYKEVGRILNYSEATIKYHMSTILKRLQLKSRADAVAYVQRQIERGAWPPSGDA